MQNDYVIIGILLIVITFLVWRLYLFDKQIKQQRKDIEIKEKVVKPNVTSTFLIEQNVNDIWKKWKSDQDVYTSPLFDLYIEKYPDGNVSGFLLWYETQYGKPFIRGPQIEDLHQADLIRFSTNCKLNDDLSHIEQININHPTSITESKNMSIHPAENQYLEIMREILAEAEATGVTPDRTGTGRVRLFGRDIRVDLSDGSVPVPTTRKINYEHGKEELLWMIKGSTNLKDLADNTKVIWKSWAIEEKHIDAFIAKFYPEGDPKGLEHLKASLMEQYLGSIGPMYGHFWRNNPAFTETSFLPYESLLMEDIPSDKLKLYNEVFDEQLFFNNNDPSQEKISPEEAEKIKEQFIKTEYFNSNDQLGEVIRGIKRRPYSARHLISSWIPQLIPFEGVYSPHENILLGRGALTACHSVPIQFFVKKAIDGGSDYLSLRMYQRSCDIPVGVATNLTFYGIMLHVVAHCTGLRPKELIWSGGDVHGYSNQIEGMKEQVTRTPLPPPKIWINPEVKDIFALTSEDIKIQDYNHLGVIKYPVSV